MADRRSLPIRDADGAIWEVHSDILADEVGEFMCTACFTVDDARLVQRYLMLTPHAQRLVRRCVARMSACIKDSETEQ
jgi:hypothetical protein